MQNPIVGCCIVHKLFDVLMRDVERAMEIHLFCKFDNHLRWLFVSTGKKFAAHRAVNNRHNKGSALLERVKLCGVRFKTCLVFSQSGTVKSWKSTMTGSLRLCLIIFKGDACVFDEG